MRAELLHDAVALFLRQSAVQRLGVVASRIQCFGEPVHFGARPAEDDRALGGFGVEDATQRGHLVRACDDVGDLAHLGRLAGSDLRVVNSNDFWIAKVRFRDRGDARWQRGRKEGDLLFFWRGGEDRLEVVGEPGSVGLALTGIGAGSLPLPVVVARGLAGELARFGGGLPALKLTDGRTVRVLDLAFQDGMVVVQCRTEPAAR